MMVDDEDAVVVDSLAMRYRKTKQALLYVIRRSGANGMNPVLFLMFEPLYSYPPCHIILPANCASHYF